MTFQKELGEIEIDKQLSGEDDLHGGESVSSSSIKKVA